MPSKKRSEKKEVHEESGRREEEEVNLLPEDDEEEEIIEDEEEFYLAENPEEKLDQALAILGEGAPAIISSETRPDYDAYPTETHRKNNVKYTPGDKVLPHNDTLILR